MLKRMKDRFNQWKTDNHVTDEEVTLGVVYAAVISGTIAAAIYAAKKYQDEVEDQRQWAASEIADGRQVFMLADGNLISTEAARLHL